MANLKEGAIIKKGHEEGLKLVFSVLEEFEFPLGVFPIQDVIEAGYVKSTGYVWITQKKKVEHYFKAIKQYVRYDTEMSGYVEKKKFTKFTGVKGKEFMLWLSVSDVTVDEPSPGKIQFTSQLAGITRSFPKEAFVTVKPVAKTVVEPVAKTVVEPVAKTVVEPVAKTVGEPVANTVAEKVAKPLAKPVAKTVVDPVAKTAVDQVAQPVVEPVARPVAEAVALAKPVA